MGAYRCIVCSINYPQDAIVERSCPICDGELIWRSNSKASDDWRNQVARRVEAEEYHVTPDVWVRAERLSRCGLDIATALMWASIREKWGGFEIDVHDFERDYKAMVASGCSHELAIRILTPDVVASSDAEKI